MITVVLAHNSSAIAPRPASPMPPAHRPARIAAGGTSVPLMEWREAWGRHGLVMFLARCRQRLAAIVAGVRHILSNCLWARPAAAHITGRGTDLLRRRAQLLAENALLRHQVVILRRSVKRPAVTATDRALLALLAGRVRAWRHALLIIQPDTLLRWHRAGFRAFWRRRSRPGPGRPPLPAETLALIRRMAGEIRAGVPSASAASSGSGASAWRSAPSRRTCAISTPSDRAGKRGQHSCATTPVTSGPATAYRSPTCASANCTPSSSSNSVRVARSTSP